MKFSPRAIQLSRTGAFADCRHHKKYGTQAVAVLVAIFRLKLPYPRGLCFFCAAGGQANHATMTANKITAYSSANTHGGAFQ